MYMKKILSVLVMIVKIIFLFTITITPPFPKD